MFCSFFCISLCRCCNTTCPAFRHFQTPALWLCAIRFLHIASLWGLGVRINVLHAVDNFCARCFYIIGGTELCPIAARVLLLGDVCSMTDMEVPRNCCFFGHRFRPHVPIGVCRLSVTGEYLQPKNYDLKKNLTNLLGLRLFKFFIYVLLKFSSLACGPVP